MISKRIKLGAAVALSSIAALSVTSGAVLTSLNSKKTSVEATPTTKKAKTLLSNEANATYHTITFAQNTQHTDIPLIGKTKVKVKDGYPFGTIVPPRIESQQ